MKRIHARSELRQIASELGMRADWHEPDEQGVMARIEGVSFDNAGFWADERYSGKGHEEMHVILAKDGEDVAAVNLATLLAWAAHEPAPKPPPAPPVADFFGAEPEEKTESVTISVTSSTNAKAMLDEIVARCREV